MAVCPKITDGNDRNLFDNGVLPVFCVLEFALNTTGLVIIYETHDLDGKQLHLNFWTNYINANHFAGCEFLRRAKPWATCRPSMQPDTSGGRAVGRDSRLRWLRQC